MDIQVNSQQKLCETFQIMWEAGLIPGSVLKGRTHVYSRRKRSRINVRMTYDQAGVRNGDRLWLEEIFEHEEQLGAEAVPGDVRLPVEEIGEEQANEEHNR